MSKLKDKLTASMQMVKSNERAEVAQSVKTASDKPVAKPAAAPSKATAHANTGGTPIGGDIPPSGTALFPSRVWPD